MRGFAGGKGTLPTSDRTAPWSARPLSCPPFRAPLLAALAVAAVLSWAPPQAWAQSTPRGAAHETFGRMVFDWDGPVQWSAEVVNGQLVVRFEKPISGDPAALIKPLSKYLKGVTLSPDRRMATFSLAVPVQVKSFVSGASTVIDLTENKSAPPLPAAAAQPAPPPVAPAKVAPAPGVPATDLSVRGGEHQNFSRQVFDWPKPVGYTVSVQHGQMVVGKSVVDAECAADNPCGIVDHAY